MMMALLQAGCAAQQPPQVVAVKTRIAKAPPSCKAEAAAAPQLPDREMTPGELAAAYKRLKAQYLREAGRSRLCRRYVARLHR